MPDINELLAVSVKFGPGKETFKLNLPILLTIEMYPIPYAFLICVHVCIEKRFSSYLCVVENIFFLGKKTFPFILYFYF